MANQGPTVQELQELINQLQAQVTALQNAAPAAPTAPAAAATAPVVFFDSPQTIGVDNIIDYSKILGKDIYEKGCSVLDDKALMDGFNMTPNKTVVFVEAFEQKAKLMGYLWKQHDYNANPFAPLGCRVEAHLAPGICESWAPHTASGFYVGNAWEHYRCHKIYITDTCHSRVCNMVFFKHKYLTMPTITPANALI